MFTTWRNIPAPTLTIAGPNEFIADCRTAHYDMRQDATTKQPIANVEYDAPRIANAYSLLQFNDGYASQMATEWFSANNTTLPHAFRTVAQHSKTAYHTIGGRTVAVVFFSGSLHASSGEDDSTQKQVRDAIQAGIEAKAMSDFVIGVSPWGSFTERAMLPQCEGVFDVLLGGGTGMAFSSSIDATAPSVLWVRPDRDGRCVNVIDILQWPDHMMPHTWIEGISTITRLVPLSDSEPDDPAMQAIIGTGATPTENRTPPSKEN